MTGWVDIPVSVWLRRASWTALAAALLFVAFGALSQLYSASDRALSGAGTEQMEEAGDVASETSPSVAISEPPVSVDSGSATATAAASPRAAPAPGRRTYLDSIGSFTRTVEGRVLLLGVPAALLAAGIGRRRRQAARPVDGLAPVTTDDPSAERREVAQTRAEEPLIAAADPAALAAGAVVYAPEVAAADPAALAAGTVGYAPQVAAVGATGSYGAATTARRPASMATAAPSEPLRFPLHRSASTAAAQSQAEAGRSPWPAPMEARATGALSLGRPVIVLALACATLIAATQVAVVVLAITAVRGVQPPVTTVVLPAPATSLPAPATPLPTPATSLPAPAPSQSALAPSQSALAPSLPAPGEGDPAANPAAAPPAAVVAETPALPSDAPAPVDQFGRVQPRYAVELLRDWPQVVFWQVGYGDSIHDISILYGTTIEAVATYNGLADASAIYAGQNLAVPVGFHLPLESTAVAEERE